MPTRIWVQPGRDDGRIALYEVHSDHPGGEAWVAEPGETVLVAMTPMVERKLQSGELVEVSAPALAEKPAVKRLSKAEVAAQIAEAQATQAAPVTQQTPPVQIRGLDGLGLTPEQQKVLVDAGYDDREALAAASDATLLALPTIGKATVKNLRKALAGG